MAICYGRETVSSNSLGFRYDRGAQSTTSATEELVPHIQVRCGERRGVPPSAGGVIPTGATHTVSGGMTHRARRADAHGRLPGTASSSDTSIGAIRLNMSVEPAEAGRCVPLAIRDAPSGSTRAVRICAASEKIPQTAEAGS